MKKYSLCPLAVLTVSFLLLVAVQAGKAHAAQTVVLKASNFMPAQHPQHKAFEDWGKEVEKRTKGAVKVNFFPGGTLTPAQQIYDGVIAGISDVGLSVFGYTPGRFPVMEAADAPLGYQKAAGATRALVEFYKMFNPKELSQVHVCYLFTGAPSMIHSKTPIRSLEDLKGKKIRSTGNSQKFIKALGAVPVAMPQTDVYDALSKGLVEGTLVATESMYNFKQYEVCKYTTLHSKTYWASNFYVVMNLNTWNAFPADIKKVLGDLNEEWAVKQGRAWDEDDASITPKLEKLGHKWERLTDAEQARWVTAAQPFYQEYIQYANGKGLDGAKIVQEVKRLFEKYGNQE
ncbi:MAG TPA: TRAP transporter substrate-binding protein [Syntrophorhabdales bacterium]|nr:TRAP transporter substrate-binding protein [Syntrophorhabdales bacterium]